MKMRLTTLIPVLLAVLLLASSALFYMLQMQGSMRSIRRDSIAEMNRLITHLQNMLDSQLTQDNLQGAELSLSVTAMHPAVRSLILADENDSVLLANRFVWRGKPAAEVARYDHAIAARAHHNRIQDISMDAHFVARGYYPITISVGTLNVGTGGGLSSRVGVLYVEMDFSSRYVTERQDALNATIGFVGSAFLVTLIITLLLHQRISRRVGLVMSATQKLMAGDPDVRVNLRGNDELAELGRDFDAMAESLQLQRQELVMKTHRLNDGQRIAQIGSWELDLVANQLVWSDEIFHIFEIDQASFGASYEAFLNTIHPDDRDAVNAAYMNSLADRKPYEITHRLRMTDGRIKWVYEHCESVFDDDDRPLRSTGTVQDITDRVLAQQESQRTRELLRSIIDTAPIRVFWKDLESRFLGCNTAFAKDAGESRPSDLVGKDDYQMAWKDQADIYRADDRKVMDSAVPKLSYEEPQTTLNGQIIWLRTSKVPLCNEHDGEVFGVLGIYEDITEHKQAEDELQRYRLHLEELVGERTIELKAAKDAAESANLAKSEFLSRMSHELRTPLNAILGFAQLMEMDALASEDNNTIENVHDVLSSGRHLLSLVNDILDFAQIEAGKLKAEPSKTNLLMIAIDGIGGVRHLAEERKIEVRLLNSQLDDLGEIWADPLRTKQVLINLLSNAIKYNKAGGSIEVALETLNSEFVRLSVKDSGIGIPEENIGELFTPFSRLHTNTAFAEGAGIGLSITKDLVEMMGGRIGVKSVKGEGTTFWIDMPTYIEHAGAH